MTPQEIVNAIETAARQKVQTFSNGSVFVEAGRRSVWVHFDIDPPEVVFDYDRGHGQHYCPWADTSPDEIRDFLDNCNRPARATWRLREDGE